MAEVFDWLQPVPFWETDVVPEGGELIRPVLLEFQSDSFMDDFLAEATSGRMVDWQKLEARVIAPSNGSGLRLYQPAHERYYLVCASLCCRQPGFPDRDVRRAEGESIFFVLRKVDASGSEYGWNVEGKTKSWQPVGAKALTPKEERLPLFSSVCVGGRSVAYGYIPVASRDTYSQPVTITDPDPANERLRLLGQFEENIVRSLDNLAARLTNLPASSTSDGQRIRELWEQISLFLLSDLADILRDTLPAIYGVLAENKPETTLTNEEKSLLNALKAAPVTEMGANNGETARTAVETLKKVIEVEGAINALSGNEALPVRYRISPSAWQVSSLRGKFASALEHRSAQPPVQAEITQIPKLTSENGETFFLRCVYERPCDPPFASRLRISERTYFFSMAPFFDTNAPARQIRIEMPTDVSLASIRKFRKGVGFMLSNALRNKMDMVKPEILKGDSPNAEGTWSLGMLCSFSLQIIFICAFILLIIIAIVLNIVFWWMPFFRICLPIPKKGD